MRLVFLLFLMTMSSLSHAETQSYALIVGNNTPPAQETETLQPLRYADDDAIRYYRFFERITSSAHLFTIPDRETQRRYPKIAARAQIPTLSNIRKAVADLERKIEKDARRGKSTTVYIVFSGHGVYTENGEPMFALADGNLTQKILYEDILYHLKADFQHLFVDACYAEGLVGTRSIFDREVNGQLVDFDAADRESVAGPRLSEFPGLGMIVAASADTETHEWSRIESGIFTHEVLSGLSGSADVNLDGEIAYSELYAFISAANSGVKIPKGKINVIARPPYRDRNAAIVDLSLLRNVSFLKGDPSSLGHFTIELENGERYLEANLSKMSHFHIALPSNGVAYLRTGDKEARFELGSAQPIDVSDLKFEYQGFRLKGSIEAALARGLFASAFSQDYYLGFVDNRNLLAVSFDIQPLSVDADVDVKNRKGNTINRALSFAGFSLAAAAVVSTTVFATLSLNARNEFENTDLQRAAVDANERYTRFGNFAWISAALIPVGIAAGLLLGIRHPKETKARQASFRFHRSEHLSLSFVF